MRVPSYLADEHVEFETVPHAPAYSASKRAHRLHVPGKWFAKCVLLVGEQGPILAILPATRRIDLAVLAEALGGPVRLARVEEIAAVFRDCEWGVLVPFGKLYGLPTILDETLDSEAMLVFESQVNALAIRMRCRDFERLEKPRRIAFSQRL